MDVTDLLQDQVVMFQTDVDSWWNLSMCHAIPAFAGAPSWLGESSHVPLEVTLLWGEELFLGWVIAGCFRP